MTETLSAADCIDFGISAFNLTDYEKASQYFDEALSKNPDAHEAMNYKGLINLQLGDYNKAIEWWKGSIETQENTPALSNLGFHLSKQERFQEAKPYLKRAYEIAPSERSCAVQWAYIELLEKNFDTAEKILTGLIDSEVEGYPELINGNVYVMLAQVKTDQRDYDGAVETMEMLLHKIPDSLQAMHQLAKLYPLTKNYEAAGTCYKKVLEAMPDHLDIIKEYSTLLMEHIDAQASVDLIEDVLSRQNVPDWELYLLMALGYEKLKDHARALDAYSKASALNPSDQRLKNNILLIQHAMSKG